MLPFAVVAPLTAPLADRTSRGKGFVIFAAAAARIAAVVLMGLWIHSLLLFPAAFIALVCSKTHAVARAALVPAVVDDQSQLVSANSKLAVGGGVASSVAAVMGGSVYLIFGSHTVLDVDVLIFAAMTALSLDLVGPRYPIEAPLQSLTVTRRVPHPEVLGGAVGAVAGFRATAGFLTALVAFGFRAQGAPLFWYALVAGSAVVGNLNGAIMAPFARRRVTSERRLISLCCVTTGTVAFAAAILLLGTQQRLAALIVAAATGFAGSIAKAAFDAMVQREIPERSRTKTFGRLEAAFQTAWVLSALAATAISTPLTVGFAVIAAVLVVLGLHLGSSQRSAGRTGLPGRSVSARAGKSSLTSTVEESERRESNPAFSAWG
jgi:hypothetical protein